MLQIAWTFNMFIHVLYYAVLLHMLGFLLSPKSYVDFCYKPSGLFFLNQSLGGGITVSAAPGNLL